MDRILWNSPPIPDDLLEQEEFALKVMEKAQELMSTDAPSSSDLDAIFARYNACPVRLGNQVVTFLRRFTPPKQDVAAAPTGDGAETAV
jgi:hypothetical protein